MILDRILREKRVELQRKKAETTLEEVRAAALNSPPALDFAESLREHAAGVPAIIAEAKKASPSKGLIRPDFDPVSIAQTYEAAGAAALSVLTEEKFFQGSLAYLSQIRAAVRLPLLRKDFLVDEYQIFEARAAGADAVLLIAAALDMTELAGLMKCAHGLGMQCLVEVHDESEMRTALESCASLIGINNRNLNTFEVDLGTTARLAPMAEGATLVSESGISSRDDLLKLRLMGVDAALIGETLMRSRDIEGKLRELIG